MNHDITRSPRAQLAGMILLSLAVFAAFWAGEGLDDAWPPLLILLVFTALVHLGRDRSATLEVMGGVGDERTTALYTRAGALTSTILSFVIAGWWLVTVARGEPNQTLSLVGLVFGVTFVLSAFAISRRG